MWKNLIIAKRHYIQTSFELLIPIVLIIVFVVLNAVSSSGQLKPAVNYPQSQIPLCR